MGAWFAKICHATWADARNDRNTPRMVTQCATLRGMTMQNRPAMAAATSGNIGIASRTFGFSDSFTRSALQGAHVFDVDAATLPEQHHEDGESDGGLGRGDRQHEE